MIKALPAIKPEAVIEQAVHTIREQLDLQHTRSIVMGLGGGVDSATALTLVSRAVPLEKITVLLLPSLTTPEEAMQRAEVMPLRLGIPESQIIEMNLAALEQALETTFRLYDTSSLSPARKEYLMGGVRLTILREMAAKTSSLAVASHHRSDRLLNLDHPESCLFSPLEELYKTQVFALAGHLGVTEDILTQTPTQLKTKQGEPLSFSEIEADPLLWALTQDNQTRQHLLDEGCDQALLDAVMTQAALV